MPLLATLLMLSALQAPEIRVVRVSGEGLTEQDLAASEARVAEELALMGATATRGDAPNAECLSTLACRSTLVGNAAGLLDVELFRVGPILQVKATLFGGDGALIHTVERAVNAEGVAQTASLLGPELAPHVRDLVASQTVAPPSEAEDAGAGTVDRESSLLPWVVLGSGLGVVGFGALASAAGVALAAQQSLTAYTATTPGDTKATALILAPAFVGVAVFGIALAAIGGGISVLALFLE